jgi:hypothetical protein
MDKAKHDWLQKIGLTKLQPQPEAAARPDAKSFTTGNDVTFGGATPTEGKELLAHELTHVVQQSDHRKIEIGAPSDPLEHEADAVAEKVMEPKKETPPKP